MADPPPPHPLVKPFSKAAGLALVIGFFVVAPLGMGLGVAAHLLGAPGWVVPVVFFSPMAAWVLGLVGLIAWVLVKAHRAGALVSPPEPPGPPRPPRGVVLGGPLAADPADPGSPLPHRLAPAGPHPLVQLGCLVIGSAVVLPVFATIGVGGAWKTLRDGDPWWMQAGAITFGALTLAFVGVVLVKLGRTVGEVVGWVAMLGVWAEASSDEWAAGGRCGLRVTRPGLGTARGVTVELVCREEVRSPDPEGGTSTAERDLARYRIGVPELPAAVAVTLPADAMPSFAEGDLRIDWRVRVSGTVWWVVPFRLEFVGPAVS
jgi:hypothetical protein